MKAKHPHPSPLFSVSAFLAFFAGLALCAHAGTQIVPAAAYAESSYNGRPPSAAIDGSGLSADGTTHSATTSQMWMGNAANSFAKWFLVDLGSVQPLASIKIWNYNQSGYATRGARSITIFTATSSSVDTANPGFAAADFEGDGTWTCTVAEATLGQGTGNASYAGEPPITFSTVWTRWVGIRINSLLSKSATYGGLSELQFFTGDMGGANFDSITCPGTTSVTIAGHLEGDATSSDSLVIAYGTTNGGEDSSAWDALVPVAAFNADGSFTATISGLTPNTAYWTALCDGTGADASWNVPQAFMTAPITVTVPADFYESDTAAQAIVFSRPASCAAVAMDFTYTLGGTAAAGTDYTEPSGSGIFGAGETTVSVPFTAKNNTTQDGARTVTVTVDTGAYVVDATSAGSFTILDDETDRKSYTWSGSGDGRLWSDSLNWTPIGVPGIADNATVGPVAEPGVLVSSAAKATKIELAKGGDTYVDITADVTTTGSLVAGLSSGKSAYVRQTGGTVTVGDTLHIGGANDNRSVWDVSGSGSTLTANTISICLYNGENSDGRLTVRDGATLNCPYRFYTARQGEGSGKAPSRGTFELLNGATANIDTLMLSNGGAGHVIVSNATLNVGGMNSSSSISAAYQSRVDVFNGGVFNASRTLKLCQYKSNYEHFAQWPGSTVTTPEIKLAGIDQGGTGTAHDISYEVHGGTLHVTGDVGVGQNGNAAFDLDGGTTTIGGSIVVDALRDVAGEDPYDGSALRLAGDATLAANGTLWFSGKQRGGRQTLVLEGGAFSATVGHFATKSLSTPPDGATVQAIVTSTGLAPLRVTNDINVTYPFTVVPSATADGAVGTFDLITWGTTLTAPAAGSFVLSPEADSAEWTLTVDTEARKVTLRRVRRATIILLR